MEVEGGPKTPDVDMEGGPKTPDMDMEGGPKTPDMDMEGALNALDASLAELLETVPVGACMLGAEGRVVAANRRAAEFLGWDLEEMVGLELSALCGTSEVGDSDLDVHLDGRTILVRTAALPDASHRLTLLVDVSTYESERAAAVREAAARSDFLARLSHEVRSAVASMIGFAEMLKEDISDSNQELAHIITLSGRHLVETLDAVMELAQIEFGNKRVERTCINLVSRVRDRVTLSRPAADRKGLNLEFRASEEEIITELNPTFLDRIVDNLIDNAIKYTREGTVEVEVEQRDGRVWIYVADTGIGMDRGFMARLFSPFERENRTELPDTAGVGLGLSATKYFVELMGGRIYACSTKGAGTTFTVNFPAPG